jgi:hypothetical protein
MHSKEESGKLAIQSDAPTNWLKGMYTECRQVLNKAASSRLISKQEAGHGRPYSLCSVLTPWKASVCLIKKLGNAAGEALVLI